jgi:hypothetical protein
VGQLGCLSAQLPNNSFKPTAGVGQLIKQPSRAGGGLILVLGAMNRFRLVALGAFLLFPFSAHAESTGQPFLLQFIDSAAQTAGIGSLKDTNVPEGNREIRIWIGFGIFAPEKMLRLQVTSTGSVIGHVLVHYKSDLSYMGDDQVTFRKEIAENCTDLRRGSEQETCLSTFSRNPNWQNIYKKLVRLGVETLPDESTLPPPEIEVNDGVCVLVELRDSAHYRAYEYCNPFARKGPEAAAATKLIGTVSKVFRMADGT